MNYQGFEIENGVLIKYNGKGSCAVTPKKFTSVRIPAQVTKIGDSAFSCCQGIDSVEIPYGVTEIGKEAFYHCKNLKSVHMPETVTKINSYAFRDCNNLTQVRLPEQLQEYGTEVFSRGVKLENYPDGFVILNHILYQYVGLDRTVRIPEGVTFAQVHSISSWELDYSVEHVIFPESMESIDIYALHQCEETKSITCHQIQVFLDEDDMKWTDAIELIRRIKMFFCCPEIKKKRRYLKQNLEEMLFYLEDKTFQEIIDSGKIYSEKNIDKYLQMAIDNQLYTKQMILMHYKYQHSEFRNPADKLKL